MNSKPTARRVSERLRRQPQSETPKKSTFNVVIYPQAPISNLHPLDNHCNELQFTRFQQLPLGRSQRSEVAISYVVLWASNAVGSVLLRYLSSRDNSWLPWYTPKHVLIHRQNSAPRYSRYLFLDLVLLNSLPRKRKILVRRLPIFDVTWQNLFLLLPCPLSFIATKSHANLLRSCTSHASPSTPRMADHSIWILKKTQSWSPYRGNL